MHCNRACPTDVMRSLRTSFHGLSRTGVTYASSGIAVVSVPASVKLQRPKNKGVIGKSSRQTLGPYRLPKKSPSLKRPFFLILVPGTAMVQEGTKRHFDTSIPRTSLLGDSRTQTPPLSNHIHHQIPILSSTSTLYLSMATHCRTPTKSRIKGVFEFYNFCQKNRLTNTPSHRKVKK